jgi:hypothetical protein
MLDLNESDFWHCPPHQSVVAACHGGVELTLHEMVNAIGSMPFVLSLEALAILSRGVHFMSWTKLTPCRGSLDLCVSNAHISIALIHTVLPDISITLSDYQRNDQGRMLSIQMHETRGKLTEGKDVLLSLPRANLPIAHPAKARLSHPDRAHAFDDSMGLSQRMAPSRTLGSNRRSSWSKEVARKASSDVSVALCTARGGSGAPRSHISL